MFQGNVYGKTTAYSVMCEQFLKGVFQEEEVEGSLKLDQEDMVNVRTKAFFFFISCLQSTNYV